MKRAVFHIVLGLACGLALGAPVRADKVLVTKGITAEAIDMGDPSKTVIGQALTYPRGKPVMKAFKITIPAGKSTILHLHEASIFAYVLSGTLEVDYGPEGKNASVPGRGSWRRFVGAIRAARWAARRWF